MPKSISVVEVWKKIVHYVVAFFLEIENQTPTTNMAPCQITTLSATLLNSTLILDLPSRSLVRWSIVLVLAL